MDYLFECLAIGNIGDGQSEPEVEAILNLSEFGYETTRMYKHLYFPDFEYLRDLRMIDEGTRFIREHIQKRRRVLVHCFAGISRSTIMCMAYLYECGMSFEEALTFIQRQHPQADPHEALIRALYDWAEITYGSSEK